MAITVNANPVRLTWNNFTVVGATTDNHDAYTRPRYNIPQAPVRRVNNRFRLAENMRINVTPLAQVRRGATQTDALLAHEQIHYDLGILAGRAMAREMETLEAATQAELSTAFNTCFVLHKDTRLGPLQARYDTQTEHGTIEQQQQRWQALISQCLANPNCSQVDGLPL